MSEVMNNPPGWPEMVSLEVIEQAAQDLGYRNRQSPKYRLVDALRQIRINCMDTGTKASYGADDLIRIVWEIPEDLSVPISRRKNLSSLRSSVNADLMALYRAGKNPEGVIIGNDYHFTICDEAKDQALARFRDLGLETGIDLQKIEETLKSAQDVLRGRTMMGSGGSESDSMSLESIRKAIRGLAEEVGISGAGKNNHHEEDYIKSNEDLEIIEAAEEEPLELEEALDNEMEEVTLPEDEIMDEEPDAEPFAFEVEEGDVPDCDEALEEPFEYAEVEEEDEGEEADEDVEDVILDDAGEGASVSISPPDKWDGSTDETGDGSLDPEKARVLAEAFNDSLAAMDRFYNQYILVPGGVYHVNVPSPNGEGVSETQVELPDFFIGKFPVTNALFEVFAEKTGYRTTAERIGYGMVYQGRYGRCDDEESGKEILNVRSGIACTRVKGACWYRPLGPDSTLNNKRNHPVVQVSLEDAMAFAAWTGKRLPTEEEWEGAMRTSRGNPLPWGDVWERNACNVEESWIGDTSPVDEFLSHANPLGLADGIGNVIEWTMSVDERVNSTYLVAKGSSWIAGNSVTLASRIALPRKTVSNILGFRCVAY